MAIAAAPASTARRRRAVARRHTRCSAKSAGLGRARSSSSKSTGTNGAAASATGADAGSGGTLHSRMTAPRLRGSGSVSNRTAPHCSCRISCATVVSVRGVAAVKSIGRPTKIASRIAASRGSWVGLLGSIRAVPEIATTRIAPRRRSPAYARVQPTSAHSASSARRQAWSKSSSVPARRKRSSKAAVRSSTPCNSETACRWAR